MMSDSLKDSIEIIYEPRDVLEIITEVKELYSKLESKIKNFIITQPTFLGELKTQLKMDIGFLSPHKKDMVLSVYGIIITEDIMKDYNPQFYAEDISCLLEATQKKNQITDDEFVGLLASFIVCLKTVYSSSNIIIQHLIDLGGMGIDYEVISSIIVQRNLLPAFSEANFCFEAGEFGIDLRFIAALFASSIENYFEKNEVIESAKSTGQLYLDFRNKYPLYQGEEILYDLISKMILELYFSKLIDSLKTKIEQKQKILSEQLSLNTVQFQPQVQKSTERSRLEQLLAAVEKTLFETLKLRKELTESKIDTLEKNIERVLRGLAIEEFGVQDITDSQKFIQYLQDAWFSIFEEYPQMVLPLIDVKLYAKFIADPQSLIEENRGSIMQQLQFKIRRHAKGERFTPSNLAFAFSRILFEILSNSTVLSLDLG
ncbi:MAG: hypothetical protein KGD64_12250 [Candidatus Heimdallarchaeota archaeon]|nr:hypothetical protein [Candidatus Heimdallarchaeota archaeon]